MKKTAITSLDHLVLMGITFLYCFVCLAIPETKTVAIVFVVGIFLYYTWKRLLTIILMALIATGLVSIFPFLAPIAFIIMLILFLARLGYIIEHWRAVLVGFYMYGAAYLVGDYEGALKLSSAAMYAGVITLIFNFLMMMLYSAGYTVKSAMPIMGSVPLIIALLFLPFLKAVDGFDAGVDSTDTVNGEATTNGVDPTPGGHGESTVPPPEGYHHTHDYYRTGPDGQVHHVRGYIASNPDGIVENNLSYNGQHLTDETVQSYRINEALYNEEGTSLEDEYVIDKKDRRQVNT